MRELINTRIDSQLDIYRGLRDSLDRRPTLSEFYMGGGSISTIRGEHDQWLMLVQEEGDLIGLEKEVFVNYKSFFKELEVTQMTKSFKMILLEVFLELDGFTSRINLQKLAEKSFELLQRKRQLLGDMPEQFRNLEKLDQQKLKRWITYWRNNPVAAWTGENRSDNRSLFAINEDIFEFNQEVGPEYTDVLAVLTQELIDFRLLQYESRAASPQFYTSLQKQKPSLQSVPFFSDLKIACGYFRASTHDSENIEYRTLPLSYGDLDPAKNFIAIAKGDSMDGGKNPIKDGDYLLLELISSDSAGSISNQTIAIETQDEGGDDQYLLRYIKKRSDGGYDLIARNKNYPIFQTNDEMRTFARLKEIISPLDMAIHQSFMRENIPPLFGYKFNPGAWQSGHVSIKDSVDQYLFVTLNKQGKIQEHQYHDYFIDEKNFHWQSQNSTAPASGKGKRIIEHERNDSNVYLFVRKNKLEGKKAAPFIFCGKLIYKNYNGEKPMNVEWILETPLTKELFEYFK